MSERKFSVKTDCLGGKEVTPERLAELAASDSGRCGRAAKGMLDALFGREISEELIREHSKRGAASEGRGEN